MNKLIFFLSALFFLSACAKESKHFVIFSGKVDDLKATQLTLQNDCDTVKIEINEDHSFIDTLKVKEGYFNLQCGSVKNEVYIKPGFNLDIHLGDSILFAGEGEAENNYLQEKLILAESLKKYEDYKYGCKLEEGPFLHLMDSVYTVKFNLLKDIKRKVCDDFFFMEESKLKYASLWKKALYDVGRRMVLSDNDYKVSDGYYAELYKNIDVNDNRLAGIYNYIYFVGSYISYITKNQLVDNDSTDFQLAYMNVMNKQVLDAEVKEKLSYNVGLTKLERSKRLDDVYHLIKLNISDQKYLDKVESIYKRLKKIERGAISPDFQFADVNGKMVGLKDLKGKLVYIDVWCTGCGPCMADLPYLQKLEKHYRGKGIHFVSINVLDKEEVWKKTIKEKHLEGIQLHADNVKINFFKAYQVRGIPRYILLDADGRIIDSSAKRPTDEKLKEQLDRLI
ncbi:TlpA family protein disulfide reductase [Puteibacter caeruleilacunae]|nr:TlpA family protein disulfide reductase [Puteibacter caeruleilacunae]